VYIDAVIKRLKRKTKPAVASQSDSIYIT